MDVIGTEQEGKKQLRDDEIQADEEEEESILSIFSTFLKENKLNNESTGNLHKIFTKYLDI